MTGCWFIERFLESFDHEISMCGHIGASGDPVNGIERSRKLVCGYPAGSLNKPSAAVLQDVREYATGLGGICLIRRVFLTGKARRAEIN